MNFHGNNLNPEPNSLPAPDLGFAPRVTPDFDALIARALSRTPRVSIPAGFAAAVTRRALAQPLPEASFLSGWGPRLALASGTLLTAAMFALAPHAAPTITSVPFDAELILLAELSTLLLFANRLLIRD